MLFTKIRAQVSKDIGDANEVTETALSGGKYALDVLPRTTSTVLANSTLAASGIENFTGTLATTLGNATGAETALETFTGTLATTLGAATMAASGSQTFLGTLATTLADATLAANALAQSPVRRMSLMHVGP